MIKISSPHTADHVYANCTYLYYSTYVVGELLLDGKQDRTVYCFSGKFTLGEHTINPGDTVAIKNIQGILHGTGVLLIAQSPSGDDQYQDITITREGAHYKVSKPWGYELWLNGEHPKYCFKKIFIKEGTQTSLQYHNFKEETNVIQYGEAVLVYRANPNVENDFVTSGDLGEELLHGPVSIHVTPKTLHRLRAKSDLLLFEVSTPFLDDVIRIQDDAQRLNGRIDSEHK